MAVVKDRPVGTLGALNATHDVGVEDADSFSLSITGTWVGTITFQVSNDNENWFNLAINNSNEIDKKQATVSTTANGLFYHEAGAFKQIRCKMTAYTSGSATIKCVTTRNGV